LKFLQQNIPEKIDDNPIKKIDDNPLKKKSVLSGIVTVLFGDQ
jgi:hypothetical protein